MVLFHWNNAGRLGCPKLERATAMAEKPEDLSLPASVVTRIIKDAVSVACKTLVSQARPNQPQRGSHTESDPRWGWLGLACETSKTCG